MRVAFLHPDLGIGGAERLIVDAALGLQKERHDVTIYTSHCDKSHCFDEVRRDDLAVTVHGDWLPTHLMGKFKIVFAGLRQLWLVFMLIFSGEIDYYDYFIVDQLSFCLPLLHMFHKDRARILFYCHFPDQKLAKHDSLLRSIYRLPFDLLEQFSMAAADSVVVNSAFTKTVYDETFTFIKDMKVPDIIYPCVDMTKSTVEAEYTTFLDTLLRGSDFFLSINRFEKKKNIELAINAFSHHRTQTNDNTTKLIICGGYDHALAENKEYLITLQSLADDLKLKHITIFSQEYSTTKATDADVIFLPSVPSPLKEDMLSKTRLLLYTPSFEHFGIVPLEAMKFGAPVLAVNNGGPLESIVPLDQDSKNGTGWLEESDPTKWSKRLGEALKLDRSKLKKNGLKQVESKFTRSVMTEGFEKNMLKTLKQKYKKYTWERLLMLWRVPFFIFCRSMGGDALSAGLLVGITFLPPGIFTLVACLIYFAWFFLFSPSK